MAYGILKVDTITFTNGGVDKSVPVSGLVQNPTFTGNVTVTGTISGNIIQGGTTVSGLTVTGTTANFASGVFTTQISGVTITGTTVSTTTGNFTSLTGTTATITSGIIASGTAALPSLAILSDPNTGIYSPGADQLAVATNGVERVKFGTSEVVFNDGGTDYDFRVEGDTNANLLFVDASTDRVGVGTTTVDNRCHIATSEATTQYQPVLRLETTSTGDFGPALLFEGNRNSISGTASIGIDTSASGKSSLVYTADSIHRWIGNDKTSEFARITSAGLVGIGTASPSVLTHLSTSTDTQLRVESTSASSANEAAVQLIRGSNQSAIKNKAGGLEFFVQGLTNEVARLDSSGRLGIGTSSPGGLFHVSGGRTLLSSSDGYELAFARVGNYFYFYNDGGNQTGKLSLTTTAGAGGGEIITFTQDTKRVGIGTQSPLSRFHVEDSGEPIIYIRRDTTSATSLGGPIWRNNSFNVASIITQNVNSNSADLTFSTSSGGSLSERARIDSSGRLLVGTVTQVGNVNGGILQLGSGITFPATAVAASDANTLDDYEEGTWTPSIGGNATYVVQQGTYIKIGKIVQVTFQVSISVKGTGGNTQIVGLPFTAAAKTGGGGVAYWLNTATAVTYISAYIYNTTNIDLYSATAAATGLGSSSIFANNATVQACITYEAA